MIPGPAPGRWASPTMAVPIRTKMPVPIIAPMPSAVRSQAVRVFFKRCSGWSASARICSMDLVLKSRLITVCPQAAGMAKRAVSINKLLSHWGKYSRLISTRLRGRLAVFAFHGPPYFTVHVPMALWRGRRVRKASNNRRWRGCRSKRNSGCHWMPRKKRWAGDSIASTIPSGAKALAINDGATALTD